MIIPNMAIPTMKTPTEHMLITGSRNSDSGIMGSIAFVSAYKNAPNMVTASNDPANSLTIYNAASSPKTLWIMFVIALIGMPFVLSYTIAVYWTFRGRVELGEHSY